MSPPLDAAALYAEVCDLFLEAHTSEGAERLVRLAGEQWPHLAARPSNPHDAETCRLTMLALLQQQAFESASAWRARSMAQFAQIGWVEGVGSLLMGEALVQLARRNDDYAGGRTLDVLVPSDTALAVLDEVERLAYGEPSGFALGPGSPSQPVLRRLVHEKRGFLLLVAGDHPGALAAYDRALEATGDHLRGRLKVSLGRLLVEYATTTNPRARARLADETERLGHEAGEHGNADVAEVAAHNAAQMRGGGRALRAYEIL